MYKKALIALTMAVSGAAFAAPQPNIVLIFNDDQGYQDLGCFGSPNIKTPRVDEMAEEGMRFTDFYVASPVCSSSRAALLTGCYPQHVGVKGVFFPNRPGGLNPKYVTLAETLRSAGYKTAAVGKWHLGDKPDFLPTNQGFDSYFGIPYSNDMTPAKDMKYAADCLYREGFSPAKIMASFEGVQEGKAPKGMRNKVPLMRNEECVEFPAEQRTITRRYTDEGIRFIDESVKKGQPFFLYLANSMPHVPLFASAEFQGKSPGGRYGDTVEEIDYNTGRILDELQKLGIAENTIVIFTSDNGPWLSKGNDSGHADPLFEGKFTCFEGGQRVPFVIRWPARIPANTVCSELASTIDLHPTLAAIAGAEAPENMDGKNILDLWTQKGAKTPHEYFFYVFDRGEAVRHGKWKYHKREQFYFRKTARKEGATTLYNLEEDIGESNNVIDQYPEIAKQLDLKLQEYLKHLEPKK